MNDVERAYQRGFDDGRADWGYDCDRIDPVLVAAYDRGFGDGFRKKAVETGGTTRLGQTPTDFFPWLLQHKGIIS